MTAQTCFHGRHIGPVILAGLDGTNWDLKGYEARGGYSALRRILEHRIRISASPSRRSFSVIENQSGTCRLGMIR